jgi:hypothetical protein
MKKTKHHGIYRKKDGRMSVRATATIDGRVVCRKKTLDEGASIEEAREVLRLLRQRLIAEQRSELRTLSDYAERWFAAKAARCRESTTRQLGRTLANHIRSRWTHRGKRSGSRSSASTTILRFPIQRTLHLLCSLVCLVCELGDEGISRSSELKIGVQ